MDHVLACGCAAAAVEEVLLKATGADLRKALNPLNDADFLTIVARLTRSLSRATAETEAEILRGAMDILDVDWPNLTSRERQRIIVAAKRAMQPLARAAIPAVEHELTVSGPRIVRQSRRGTKAVLSAQFSSRIGVSLSLQDQAILDHLVASQAHYVTDEYGRRALAFSAQARALVAEGLAEGLGRDDITANLVQHFGPKAGIARSRGYWNVIAGTFANRSRTWGQLASYQEAAIERYVFEAVLDERTTDQCGALHGRTFQTADAIDRYQRVAASEDPEAVKDLQPWLRVGRGPDGERILYTQARDGTRTFVGEVVQSRVGQRDALPVLRNMRSTGDLAEMGLVTPPLHGNCRSTIVADV